MPTQLSPINQSVSIDELPTGDLPHDLAVLKQAKAHIEQQMRQANEENQGGVRNNYYTFEGGQGDQDMHLVAGKAQLIFESVKQALDTYSAKGENEKRAADIEHREWDRFFSAFGNKNSYRQSGFDTDSSAISLKNHQLTELSPTLRYLPTLTTLNLDNNNLTKLPRELVESPSLSSVSLHGNPLESLDNVIDFAQKKPSSSRILNDAKISIDEPTSIATLKAGEQEKFQTEFDDRASRPGEFQRPLVKPQNSDSKARQHLTTSEQSLDNAWHQIHMHRAKPTSEVDELIGVPGGRDTHQIEALFTYQSKAPDGTTKTEEVYIHATGYSHDSRSTAQLSIDCKDENVKRALEQALLKPTQTDIAAAREARIQEIAFSYLEGRWHYGVYGPLSEQKMQDIRTSVEKEPPITAIGISALYDRLRAGNLAARYSNALKGQQSRDVSTSRSEKDMSLDNPPSPPRYEPRQSFSSSTSSVSTELPPYEERRPSIERPTRPQQQNNAGSFFARLATTIVNWVLEKLGISTANNSQNVASESANRERKEYFSPEQPAIKETANRHAQNNARDISQNSVTVPGINTARLSPSSALISKYSIQSDIDSRTQAPIKVYVDKETRKESFRVKDNGIEVTNPSQESINNALDLLKSNGHKELNVSGSPEFKAMVYIAAEKANMVANGLSAEDMKLVASMKAAQAQKDAPNEGLKNTGVANTSPSTSSANGKKKLLLADQIPRKLIDASAEVLVNNPKTSGKDQVFTIEKIEGDIVTLKPKFDSTRLQFELQSKGPYRVDLSKPSAAATQIKTAIHQNQLNVGEQFTIQKDGIRKGDTTSAQRSNSQSHSR